MQIFGGPNYDIVDWPVSRFKVTKTQTPEGEMYVLAFECFDPATERPFVARILADQDDLAKLSVDIDLLIKCHAEDREYEMSWRDA